jgi:nucleotide-binding universal stress UspA family protein
VALLGVSAPNNPMANTIQRIRFKNILYSTDFSQASQAALPYALAVAEHYGAKIYVVHAISPELYAYLPPESVNVVVDAAEASANESMRKLTGSGVFADIPHSAIVKDGEIWDVMNALVSEHNIDLIVVGTHGRRGLSKLVMGSVAEEVFRLATCPVLTVGPHGIDTPPPHELRRILLATDFSADSIRAINYAISLGEEFQACLIAIHVAPSPEDPCVKMRLTDFFTERLSELVPTEVTPWCDLEYVVEFGTPAEAILRISRERQAELIVMGVRGAGALVRTSTHFGATVHRVVTEAHCPVLTIRG